MHYRSIVRIAVLAVSFLSSNSATIAQEIQCSFEVNACDKPLVNNLAQRCTGAGVDVLSPETQQCCNSILLAQASLSGCARRDLLAAYTGHADGTTLIDISGNGNDGILSGAQVVERSAPADYALSFPGGESHVSIPGDFLRAQPLNELTISLEVKREGLDLESRFISLASGFQAEENYIMLGQGTGSASIRTRVVTNENTVHTLSTQQEIPDQEYAHVALVYTGAKIEVYIDGLLQSSLEQSGPILIPQNLDLFLGANPNSPVPFHGELDNILLYSRALAPSEIARMAGHEFFISPSTPYALTIQEGSSPSPENLRREYQIANLTGTQKQFGLTLDGTPGWLNIVGGYTSLSVPADSLRSFSAELINLEELPSGGHSSSILLTELQSLHQRKGKHALKKKIARILRSPKRLGMWLTRDCASLRSSRRVRRCTRIQSRLQRSQVVSSYDGTSSSPASEFGPSITLPVSVLVGSGNNNTQVAHCKDPGAIKPGPGNTGPYNASLLTTYTVS
ncbi:MAG: LamG domain-containing protein, partial [Bdellovibrionales bacterium]|nr:LamG domain-containing protein [Bdellovibrionales bacterium]